jgi:hypothetical protein
MSDTYELLQAARTAFKAFERDTVWPLTGLNETQAGKLTFAELAKQIHDPDIRKRYCELAIEMIDANIAYYRAFATSMQPPTHTNTLVIVSTLVVAAAVEYQAGIAAALLASAAWYYVAAETARRRRDEHRKQAETHNEEIPSWAKSIQAWETDRNELVILKMHPGVPA